MKQRSESKIIDTVDAYKERVQGVRNELTKNPARSDKSIAAICMISKASVYRIREGMELSGEIKTIPPHERRGVGDKKVGKRNTDVPDYLSGPRIKIPEGMTLEEVIRMGMKVEAEEGRSAIDAATVVGVGEVSYRQAKTIVLLSDMTNLNSEERELVSTALEMMKRERRTRTAHKLIKEISLRTWGSTKSAYTEKTVKKVISDFMNAITIITESCDHGRRLTVPQLSSKEAIPITLQIKDAERALKELRNKLKGRLK